MTRGPELDINFDTMGITVGIQVSFAIVPLYKGFPAKFNETGLCNN